MSRPTRKQFMLDVGATCANWRWSWSFVNHAKKFVVFGYWDINDDAYGSVILEEHWQYNGKDGRKQPGWDQSIEHLRLIQREGYALKVFRMIYDGPPRDERVEGAARIKRFDAKLESRHLKKVGPIWYAVNP